MSKSIYIKLTTVGVDIDVEYDIYADGVVLIEENVPTSSLESGYIVEAPDETTFISLVTDTGCGDIELDCSTTTTTTTTPVTTTTTTIDISSCLTGLVIEAFYLDKSRDYELLNPLWYPKPGDPDELHKFETTIGTHDCGRALFYLKGNDIYIGDILINNNDGGFPEIETPSGNTTGVDYENNYVDIMDVELSANSRYTKVVITSEQAIEIAATSPYSSTITFSFDCPLPEIGCHEFRTWVLIKDIRGKILYNGVPSGGFVTVDVCQEYNIDPALGLYYRMVNCNGDYCYIGIDNKINLESMLGTFEVGDRFYIDPLGYQEHLYTWENVLEYFDVLPPNCIIDTITRTEDICES